MDPFAAQAANALVGNPPNEAVIEILGGGAAFEFDAPAVFALTGFGASRSVNGEELPGWMSVLARPGARISVTARARAYLSVCGGWDAPLALGSRSVYAPAGLGVPLSAGDILPARTPSAKTDLARLAGRWWDGAHRPAYAACPTLRVLPGPHLRHFAPGAWDGFCGASYRLSAASNRMGLRMEGPPLTFAGEPSLPSLGVFPGVVQVPPDGQPILLMADAQTTGGYPILAVVIQADLPLAAHLLPGDAVRFAPATPSQAVAALRQTQRWLADGLRECEGDALAFYSHG
jgi:biotin-dependent carboxylase-like uncharacterized protein